MIDCSADKLHTYDQSQEVLLQFYYSRHIGVLQFKLLCMYTSLLGYEPADLTVHTFPPKRSSVGLCFTHRCLVPRKTFPQRKGGFCKRYLH